MMDKNKLDHLARVRFKEKDFTTKLTEQGMATASLIYPMAFVDGFNESKTEIMKLLMIDKVWGIVHKKSGVLYFTLRSTRKASIEEVTHNYCSSWEELKSDGYKVEKFEIMRIK